MRSPVVTRFRSKTKETEPEEEDEETIYSQTFPAEAEHDDAGAGNGDSGVATGGENEGGGHESKEVEAIISLLNSIAPSHDDLCMVTLSKEELAKLTDAHMKNCNKRMDATLNAVMKLHEKVTRVEKAMHTLTTAKQKEEKYKGIPLLKALTFTDDGKMEAWNAKWKAVQEEAYATGINMLMENQASALSKARDERDEMIKNLKQTITLMHTELAPPPIKEKAEEMEKLITEHLNVLAAAIKRSIVSEKEKADKAARRRKAKKEKLEEKKKKALEEKDETVTEMVDDRVRQLVEKAVVERLQQANLHLSRPKLQPLQPQQQNASSSPAPREFVKCPPKLSGAEVNALTKHKREQHLRAWEIYIAQLKPLPTSAHHSRRSQSASSSASRSTASSHREPPRLTRAEREGLSEEERDELTMKWESWKEYLRNKQRLTGGSTGELETESKGKNVSAQSRPSTPRFSASPSSSSSSSSSSRVDGNRYQPLASSFHSTALTSTKNGNKQRAPEER